MCDDVDYEDGADEVADPGEQEEPDSFEPIALVPEQHWHNVPFQIASGVALPHVPGLEEEDPQK